MRPIEEEDENDQTIIDNSDGHNKESLNEETGDSGVESDVSRKESVKENQGNGKVTSEKGDVSNKVQENGKTERSSQHQKSKEKSVNASGHSTDSNDGSKFNTESSSSISGSSIASSRPRRKAAPVVLVEAKLNTKLRRPR